MKLTQAIRTVMSWNNRSPESNASSSSPSSTGHRNGKHIIHSSLTHPKIPQKLVIKSKFDAEFRRFSIDVDTNRVLSYDEFRHKVEDLHGLHRIPFTLCYTSNMGDLLPITNDENFRKSFESSTPFLRLLIQRKGESWEEKYGYGTETMDRKRKGLSSLLPVQNKVQRSYNISNPEDFRQVSAIIDVDIVPETHRRVRLCKHGGEDKKLGFYIREGTTVKVTAQGVEKVNTIFISRLIAGGLAESSGLLGLHDEILEVNGISVAGKTMDQVTDMMTANAHNLIITIKPANQRNTLQPVNLRGSGGSGSLGSANRRSVGSESSNGPYSVRNKNIQKTTRYDQSDSEEDDVIEYFDGPTNIKR